MNNIDWINRVTGIANVEDWELEVGERVDVESVEGDVVTVEVLKIEGEKAVIERVSTGYANWGKRSVGEQVSR
jgi:hypothetical protein